MDYKRTPPRTLYERKLDEIDAQRKQDEAIAKFFAVAAIMMVVFGTIAITFI